MIERGDGGGVAGNGVGGHMLDKLGRLHFPLFFAQVSMLFILVWALRDLSQDRPELISRMPESTSEQEFKKRVVDAELQGEEEQECQMKRKKLLQHHATSNTKEAKQHLDTEYLDPTNYFDQLPLDLVISCLVNLPPSNYGTVARINCAFRSIIQSGEVYRLRPQQGNNWIFFSCNALEWEAYDPDKGNWLSVPKMPSSPTDTFRFSDKESLAVGTELLVFGKEWNSYTVLKYSILTNSWSPGVLMNSARCLFGSASLGGKAIVAGGTNGNSVLCSAELYDSETQTWETLPAMNKARKMCSGVFMNGKFYVIGGITNNNKVLTCGEEYDLKHHSWRLIPNMSVGLNGANGAPPLVAVVNDELYAVHYANKEVMKYNMEIDTWSTLGKFPERFVSMNGWGLAFRACGDRLIVIVGQQGTHPGAVELNSWIPTGGPPQWNTIATNHSGKFVYNCAIMNS
ncbi:hypothetical protein ZIOFF_056883 [Zingiber officinale]|uniref:F-box domain-containing protein n=2 Tax=Zingiber officinale TaxID=94328 RepID=A0A8J5FJI8_ZINOF|nr:hypothetical protein ZIOFF_056883 [Zingiber officinale]